jgi:uncharacterized protein (DUF2132 family)
MSDEKFDDESEVKIIKSKDPLHGLTLEKILTELVTDLGWEELGLAIRIKCFNENPSIKSSLTFLRRTEWARGKVERMYIWHLRQKKRKQKTPP